MRIAACHADRILPNGKGEWHGQKRKAADLTIWIRKKIRFLLGNIKIL